MFCLRRFACTGAFSALRTGFKGLGFFETSAFAFFSRGGLGGFPGFGFLRRGSVNSGIFNICSYTF
jgi:hypothetical protein